MANEKGEISTQLLNFFASSKKKNNKTTIAISWDLNGLHHALIRVKKVQAENDSEVDWSGVEVANTLTMDQGGTSTEYDGAQEGYKYQIEGVGVDVFGDTSEAANTPKAEVFTPKAVESNPDPEPDPSPEQPTEKLFEFHYVPDEGVLPGLIFEQQTEDVINDVGNYAYFAQKTASKALKTGLEASKAARTALNAAQDAQSTADRATELGNTGISKADAAQETADKALKKAETNEVSIAANSSSIATLQSTVNGQQTQLDGNLTNISGLKKQVAENKQSIDGNSKVISQCIMTIQESQRYTTTDKTDANDLTDYGRIYLPNALLHCPTGVTYPVLLDVVPSYLEEDDDVLVQRVVDANGVLFYRLAMETTGDATTTYTFGDWKSIDTRYLKLTGGTVTGQTTFSGKLTASGETSVPTPSIENNSKTIANTKFVHGVVSDLVNGAPDALDTLQELATALGNDPNFSTTILNKIGEKESKTDAQIEYKKLQNAITALKTDKPDLSGYYTKAEVDTKVASTTPTGTVFPFAGSTTPDGYLLCDGSAVSRSTYANLFKVIGTTYGSGDGSSTFNLPNLVNKFVEGGSSSGAVKSAGLPNITGEFSASGGAYPSFPNGNGAFKKISVFNSKRKSSDSDPYDGLNYDFDASRVSSIYGSSNTVQPPAIVMRYIIKT